MASEKRFGYEWNKYDKIDSNYENQFKRWIFPLKPEDFKNKKVLDAGCGMGRNSLWALKYGSKELFAFDYDKRSVSVAKRNLSVFSNANVNFESIYKINYQDKFDIAFCIGVIHHLKYPDLAISNLIKAVKQNGIILIWVYGYEGNEWINNIISPLRKYFFSKLPVFLLHFLSYLFSIPLYLFVKIFPQKSPYLKQVSGFKFAHLHSIVFDQLLPEIANYYKKEEAYQLLSKHNLKDIVISHTNKNSWTIYGKKR
ncbi:MAG: class I SAM-dependent methyltransferase [bacterium]